VCPDADSREVGAAIERVHAGEPWLPAQQTYEVLQDGVRELAVSAEERRSRLGQVAWVSFPSPGWWPLSRPTCDARTGEISACALWTSGSTPQPE
jgi:hypothetical protein